MTPSAPSDPHSVALRRQVDANKAMRRIKGDPIVDEALKQGLHMEEMLRMAERMRRRG